MEETLNRLHALRKETNAGGHDLTKRNKVIDILVGPRGSDPDQTDRLIDWAIELITRHPNVFVYPFKPE